MTLIPNEPGRSGYRTLRPGPPAERTTRGAGVPGGEPLLTVAHLSDLHVCDAQSPARVEFLDRWADPDSPLLDQLDEVGTYRAQELLTVQVVDAMAQAVNAVRGGPVGGAALDFAVLTGDLTDNAQANELGWLRTLLDGGTVLPDSGDRTRWEGVADGEAFDERFWHPETDRADLPRGRYGFPRVPGLLDAARAPFPARGLDVPWLAVHGNHDQLLQGTVPALGGLAEAAIAAVKPIGLPTDWSTEQVLTLLGGLAACDPAALLALRDSDVRLVTADAARRITSRDEFVAALAGHGFTAGGPAFYRHDQGRVTLLVLDSVNHHGGWEGSLDTTQLTWLESELAAADADRRYVVLASHHPLATFVNDDGPDRVLAAELSDLLSRHPSVVLWLNGHTHRPTITEHARFWEVTAPSLIDWPQQGRIVELLRGADGTLTIAATMLDHAGTAPWGRGIDTVTELAGLSRELAANDWQWRGTPLERHPRGGDPDERDVLLLLPDPWA